MTTQHKYVFFVGSGVSAKSGLPLFYQIREELSDFLEPRAMNRLQELSMEALLKTLASCEIDVGAELRNVFNLCNSEPHLLHITLAKHVIRGERLWTTNYDTLVEDAIKLLDPCHKQIVTNRITKPHGTFVRKDNIWTQDHGLLFSRCEGSLQWPDQNICDFQSDVEESVLVLIGYSGNDVITYELLTKAIDRACEVYWYEAFPETHKTILNRFPSLEASPSKSNKIAILDPGYKLFLRKFDSNQKSGCEISSTEDVEFEPTRSHFSSLRDKLQETQVQLKILERAGEAELLKAFHNDLWRHFPSNWKTCLGNLKLTYRLWGKGEYLKPVRKFVWKLALRVPAPISRLEGLRARGLRERDLLDIDNEQNLQKLTIWVQSCKDRGSKAMMLNFYSRCLRELGRYREAVEHAEHALEISMECRLAIQSANAQMEIVEASRSMGCFDLARQHLRLRREHDAAAMVNWIAWLKYEQGCLALQENDLTEAERLIDHVRKFFSPEGGKRQYQANDGYFYSLTAKSTILLCFEHRIGEALDTLESIDKKYYLNSKLKSGLYAFKCGEALRVLQKYDEAEKAYNSMNPTREMHGALRLTGLALVSLARGGDDASERLVDAREKFVDHECSWGIELLGTYITQLESGHTPDYIPPILFN